MLAYLWRRDQKELLQEMIQCGLKAMIIKVAALGAVNICISNINNEYLGTNCMQWPVW